MNIRDKLNAFFDRSARRRFRWGECDCVLEVADWLDMACGLEIAPAWRGRYANEDEAMALVNGDLRAAMAVTAAENGLAETVEPLFGDVGIVTLPGQERPLAAILMPSGRWRMRTATGIVMTANVAVLAAWSLSCRSKAN